MSALVFSAFLGRQSAVLHTLVVYHYCFTLDLIAVANVEKPLIFMCRAKRRRPKIVVHVFTEILQLFDINEQCSCEPHANVLIYDQETQILLCV